MRLFLVWLVFTVFFFLESPLAQLLSKNGTNSSSTPQVVIGPMPQVNLKVGLLFANSTQQLRTLFGFGQSAPAINIAQQRAASEHLVDNVNLTLASIVSFL